MKSYASLQRIFTISGADMCVKQNMGEIANHFLRQKYHFEVPCGWCNDPNGFIYWNGSYHLFYQHNPFAADPEDFKMFWGHAVSNDLVHWEYVKPALAPGLTYDNAGCWIQVLIVKTKIKCNAMLRVVMALILLKILKIHC